MSAYVVFTHIRTRDWIIDHSTSVNSWRRRVIKGSIGVESLVNHMRPDPGRPFMSLPPSYSAVTSIAPFVTRPSDIRLLNFLL